MQYCVLKALTSVYQTYTTTCLADGNPADGAWPTPKSHNSRHILSAQFTWAQVAAMLRWLAEILHCSRRKTLDLHRATGKLQRLVGC